MRTRNIYFFLALLGILGSLKAQQMSISGRVLDAATGEPLRGAEVFLLRSKAGTTTDSLGVFLLQLSQVPPGDTLAVRFLGYREFRVAFSQYKNKSEIFLESVPLPGESVEVSAEKIELAQQDIPHAKSVLRYRQIQQYGSSEISDLFKTIPSVHVEGNDLDGRRIQIRGSDPDEVNVYLDGVLINNLGVDNAADLTLIPTESIEKLEVLKGANLTLLGSGAFGGVVNITTRRNPRPGVLLRTKRGSFRSRYYIWELDLPISRKFYVNYFGQLSGLKPEIEYFPGERFAEKTASKSIDTQKQNHHLNFYYITDSGVLNAKVIGYFFDYEKPFWISRRDNLLSSLNYQGRLWGISDLQFNVNHLWSRDKIERSAGTPARFRSELETNRLGFRATKKFSWSVNEFQLLAEYFHDELNDGSTMITDSTRLPLYRAFLYDNRGSVAGVFAARDYLKNYPNVSWKTYLGTRADFLSTGEKHLTHTIGVEVTIYQSPWKFIPYANFGTNNKYPTLLENAFVALQNIEQGDTTFQRLEPEFSSSFEFGLNVIYRPVGWVFESLDMSLAFFTNSIVNKLLQRPFEELEINSQVGKNVTRGVEGQLSVNHLIHDLNLSSSFTLLHISDPLLYAYKPDRKLSFQLEYSNRQGFYFSTTYFFEGKSVAWFYNSFNRLQTDVIPGFNDMDISAGVRLDVRGVKLNLQFSGYNIFDNSGFRFYLLKKRFLQFAFSVEL